MWPIRAICGHMEAFGMQIKKWKAYGTNEIKKLIEWEDDHGNNQRKNMGSFFIMTWDVFVEHKVENE